MPLTLSVNIIFKQIYSDQTVPLRNNQQLLMQFNISLFAGVRTATPAPLVASRLNIFYAFIRLSLSCLPNFTYRYFLLVRPFLRSEVVLRNLFFPLLICSCFILKKTVEYVVNVGKFLSIQYSMTYNVRMSGYHNLKIIYNMIII